MVARKSIYKVVFHNQGKIYELHAGKVGQSEMYGFVEVADIRFGERTAMVVDPSEERLKSEFEGVKRTFLPMHSILRVDEVKEQGANKVVAAADSSSNVTPFPVPFYTPGGGEKS